MTDAEILAGLVGKELVEIVDYIRELGYQNIENNKIAVNFSYKLSMSILNEVQNISKTINFWFRFVAIATGIQAVVALVALIRGFYLT